MDLQKSVQDPDPYHEKSDADMSLEASTQAIDESKENDEAKEVNLADVKLVTDAPLKKKKKKNKPKSKSQRGVVGAPFPLCLDVFVFLIVITQNKPTGFEPFFADAPLTPAQVVEEADIYSPTLSFNVRILTAIQRYENKRKLDPNRRDMFYKWLVYGGVRVGPNMFQGLSVRDREGLDKDQITSNLAQTSLDEDQNNHDGQGGKYAVDFEGVMRGFLYALPKHRTESPSSSHRVSHIYGLNSPALISKLTSTLLNFLNYLLHHNVCPEHTASINSARHILNLATTDLTLLEPAQDWLPGDFNTSLAILFDLIPAQSTEPWANVEPDDPTPHRTEDHDKSQPRPHGSITIPLAAQIARVGLACTGSDALFDAWTTHLEPHLSSNPLVSPLPQAPTSPTTRATTQLLGLEILTLTPPTDATRAFYRTRTPDFRALGTLTAKPWFGHPGEATYDYIPEEEERDQREKERRSREERWELGVEEQAMAWLRVGMRVLGTVGWWDGSGGEGVREKGAVGLAFWVDVLGVWPAWEGGAPVNDLVVEGKEMGWREGTGRSEAGGNMAGSLDRSLEGDFEGRSIKDVEGEADGETNGNVGGGGDEGNVDED
ncbi:MAG: hypothetical protein Q9160_001642 [Pyrenula sp. 1 TL-2023]